MPSYRGYRFSHEIISHAVWLYHRFALSFRDVEDLLARRGHCQLGLLLAELPYAQLPRIPVFP